MEPKRRQPGQLPEHALALEPVEFCTLKNSVFGEELYCTLWVRKAKGALESWTTDVLDLEELHRSLSFEGTFMIFTSTMGDPWDADRHKGISVWHRAGDVFWHDLDRDLWLRVRQRELQRCLESLQAWAQRIVDLQAADSEEIGVKVYFRPYQNAKFLGTLKESEGGEDSLEFGDHESDLPCVELEERSPYWIEGGSWARDCRPDTSVMKLLETAPADPWLPELVDLCGWLDIRRLHPYYSTPGDFFRTLSHIVPDLSKLPQVERRLLILAAVAPHGDETTFMESSPFQDLVEGFGDHWCRLAEVRTREPFDSTLFHDVNGHRLGMVARILALAEALNAEFMNPSFPHPDALPQENEEEEDMDFYDRLADDLFPPISPEQRREVWIRAFLSRVERGKAGQLQLKFELPRGRVDPYERWLVEPKVAVVSEHLELLRPQLRKCDICLGPLEVTVVSSPKVEPMPAEVERLFEVS